MKRILGSFGTLAGLAVVVPIALTCAAGEELTVYKSGAGGTSTGGSSGDGGAGAGGNTATGGAGGTGANTSAGGAGGAGGTGGVTSAGGAGGGTGGDTSAGGTGGVTGTGGTGGDTSTGGASGTGGITGTGGTGGTGGATGGTGGATTCTAETDPVFCTRLAKTCGTVTANDNCGTSRTVTSCGTCTAPQTCGASNTCSCAAETETAFCTRLAKTCGSVTAADNCGTNRTVASCGPCAAPKVCTANVCADCVQETDAVFCSRLGKNCGGPITANDNCGTSKTVASCGTCTSPNVCGTTNVCAPSGCTLTPFGGTARAIPGTIQFEDYDVGGEGCSFHDTGADNQGGDYRGTGDGGPIEGVDIQPVGGGEPAGFNLGWVSVGEWLKYTVNVTGATHDFSFRVSCASGDATTCPAAFHMENESGTNLTPGGVTIPGTANGQTYTTVTVTGIALPAGTHTLKIVMDALPFTVNLNFFSAT
jgi:hypothetical protein